MTIFSQTNIHQLPALLPGRVLLLGDPGFLRAHRPWNLAVEQEVVAVVEAADADDVATLVRWAHENGESVATQPSGHGATGRASGAVLLRTSRLDGIEVDPSACTARVGSGVRSGDLQLAAAAHGLTALPGSSPVVSVTGAALGGGLSWFGRKYGWMADSILAADVVMADGTTRWVTPDTEPELFWALGGGAGDLVVVTSLELRLHPAPTVFGGRMLWPAAHAREVAAVFRAMADTAPEELTLWLELLSFPGAEPMVAIDSTYLGDEVSARELLLPTGALPAPQRDTRSRRSVAELGTITAEPTDPAPGVSRAELLTGLDATDIEELLAEPIAPLMAVQVRHLAGALAGPTRNPHGPLSEPFALYMFGSPTDGGVADAIGARQAELAGRLPVSGRKPVTFLNPREQLDAALSEASVRRLGALKQTLDPCGTIRGNFSLLRRLAAEQ